MRSLQCPWRGQQSSDTLVSKSSYPSISALNANVIMSSLLDRFNVFHRCWKPPGNTRWWAELELLIFLLENFEDLATFCSTADGDGDMEKGARIQRLKEIMANDVSRAILKFELGVVGIVGKNMIQATYNLEGDQCCALVAFTTVVECSDWLNENYDDLTFPGISDVIDDCVTTLLGDELLYEGMSADTLKEYVREKAKACLSGGVKYFNDTIIGKLNDDLMIHKTCRYANPVWMRDNLNTPNLPADFKTAVTNLNRFKPREIESMLDELIRSRREVDEFYRYDDEGLYNVQMARCATFWRDRFARLPHLANFARYCFTLAPSSNALLMKH